MPATRLLPLFLASWAIGLLSACNRPSDDRFDEVHQGMTTEEVLAILGTPSSRRTVPPDEVQVMGYAERWQYGDTLSSLATEAAFPDAPDPRVFVVAFDESGHVVSTRRPEPVHPDFQQRQRDMGIRPGT